MEKRITIGLLALCSLFTANAHAADVYATKNEAAIAALVESVGITRQTEVGGCIYKVEGGYTYTEPSVSPDSTEFKAHCMIPKGSLAGLYHTHPSTQAVGFSKPDVDMANGLNKTSYVLDVMSGKLIKYEPKTNKVKWDRGVLVKEVRL